ncbi:hypothetical protein [Amycolatopsis taiwanensis]|nr:hypothetical protein [Amycolatopsis taiwanensis]
MILRMTGTGKQTGTENSLAGIGDTGAWAGDMRAGIGNTDA